MEIDILMDKWKRRGYYFICNGKEVKAYKPIEFTSGEHDYTLSSTAIRDENGKFPSVVTIIIDKFVEKGELRIAEAICRSLDEINDFFDNIERAVSGNGISPFSDMSKKSNLRIQKRRNAWIAK